MKALATAALSIVAALLTAGPASSQAPPPTTPPTTAPAAPKLDVQRGRFNTSVDFDASDASRSAAPATGATGAPGGAGHAGGGAPLVTYVVLDTLPDGSRCLRLRRGSPSDARVAGIRLDTEAVVANLVLATYPTCPRADGGEPETTAAIEAVRAWRQLGQDMLPEPSPRIAPGYMLAGKTAYLEAAGQPTAHFENPTPLGLLVIDATSRLFVDWGDGSGRSGPYAGMGGPWPDGGITHFWTTTGAYDIRVVQRWSARWSLGTAKGALDGLETTGGIDDFEVRQLQAVRNS